MHRKIIDLHSYFSLILTLLCLEQGVETPSSSSQSWVEMPLTKKVPKWAGLEKSQTIFTSFFDCQQKRAEKRKHEGKDSQATLKRNNTYLLTTYILFLVTLLYLFRTRSRNTIKYQSIMAIGKDL